MKMFLIDGHALIFKMYYAFLGRPMINGKGVDTSILFGFTKYLIELVEREKPTHLAVSFDPPGGTFRNEMYPEYKSNRGETPQLVIDALEPLTNIVRAMNVPVVMMPGFEADDVIGSMAKRFAREGFDVYMVTPDKDYGQLIEDHIIQYRPGKAGGDNEVLGPKEVCEKWGIDSPSQVIDILALCGDSADNVPGVDGIGPVSASKLLLKYGTLENIYGHLNELSAKQQEKFVAAQDHIALSKELVTIKTDIPVELDAAQMKLDWRMNSQLSELFSLYEFNSLRRRFPVQGASFEETVIEEPAEEIKYSVVSEIASKRISICFGQEDIFIADRDSVFSDNPLNCKALLEDPSVEKIGYELKTTIKRLKSLGVELRGPLKDISIMHYVLDPERSHDIQNLSQRYLKLDLSQGSASDTASLFDDENEDKAQKQLESVAIFRIAEKLTEELCSNRYAQKLYDDIEQPLIRVLADMESVGVKVDIDSLREFTSSLRKEVGEHEAKVREIAGEPDLNVSSPKQVGEVLFEKLRLDPKAKKPTKGNWPTDEETLTELFDRSPIIGEILEFRGTKKLLSTYIEPIPGYISDIDGRVHTTFNQTITATGRLSSSNPNLQNIPIRTEQGRQIRAAFVPEDPSAFIMSSDYSQIELRIMAHLCGDEHLKEAFRSGVDVHAATASKIFGVPVEEVSAEQRRVAKTANFGIMYGISSFGLSQRLKCSRSEAKQIIDDYFASFPSIRAFIDDTLVRARADGYVQTIFGRRRYVPDVNSHNGNIRALAERNAVNAPIQGSAADIIKLAMIAVGNKLRDSGLKSRMVLQIHDELLLEVPEMEVETVKQIVISGMEGAAKLSVPLTVECNYGKTWLEAH